MCKPGITYACSSKEQEALSKSPWLKGLEDRIAEKPFLLGWADEDDELKSSSYATLKEAVGAMKLLKGRCLTTAFIEDRTK